MPAAPVDRPRLRTSRDFPRLSSEGGQDFSLLALRYLEFIKGAGQLLGDRIEHGGGDLQVKMGVAQLSAGVGKGPPVTEASHKVLSHLSPGIRVW